jgi:hypothetical protein
MSKNKVEERFEIEADQKAWLEDMAREHGLPDASKALRVILDFARTDGDLQQIFGEIRCFRC